MFVQYTIGRVIYRLGRLLNWLLYTRDGHMALICQTIAVILDAWLFTQVTVTAILPVWIVILLSHTAFSLIGILIAFALIIFDAEGHVKRFLQGYYKWRESRRI